MTFGYLLYLFIYYVGCCLRLDVVISGHINLIPPPLYGGGDRKDIQVCGIDTRPPCLLYIFLLQQTSFAISMPIFQIKIQRDN